MLNLDSKGDPQKDFDNFTLNLSEAKMKIAYPQNENSVSYRAENICWAFLKSYVVMSYKVMRNENASRTV